MASKFMTRVPGAPSVNVVEVSHPVASLKSINLSEVRAAYIK